MARCRNINIMLLSIVGLGFCIIAMLLFSQVDIRRFSHSPEEIMALSISVSRLDNVEAMREVLKHNLEGEQAKQEAADLFIKAYSILTLCFFVIFLLQFIFWIKDLRDEKKQ